MKAVVPHSHEGAFPGAAHEHGFANQRYELPAERAREWRARLAIIVTGSLIFATLSGRAIGWLPFSVATQVTVFLHALAGLTLLIPCLWYTVEHLLRYWRNPPSHIQVLGHVGGLVLCCVWFPAAW